MIIQCILIGVLAIIAVFAYVRRKKAPLVALFVLTLSSVGVVFVLYPPLTQSIAAAAGIGRGVDLITYLFMAIMLMIILDIYLRLLASMEMLTLIVRRLSLLEAPANHGHSEEQS